MIVMDYEKYNSELANFMVNYRKHASKKDLKEADEEANEFCHKLFTHEL